MSEMSFEQMLEESFKTIRNGEVVEGVVILYIIAVGKTYQVRRNN